MPVSFQDSKFDVDKVLRNLPHSIYRLESLRIESFTDWPWPWERTLPKTFAAAGLYYTGEIDVVKCFECHINLGEWMKNDDPMDNHKQESPRCRFIRDIPCGNVPIGIDPSTIPIESVVCGSHSSIQPSYASRLKYPKYATHDARLASFATWPKRLLCLKERLVAAGLFYTGQSDRTECYECGVKLIGWKVYDNPLCDHAQSSRNCTYILRVKGRDYIDQIIKSTRRIFKVVTVEPSTSRESAAEPKEANKCIASGSSQSSTSTVIKNTGSAKGCRKGQSTAIIFYDFPDWGICKYCRVKKSEILFLPCEDLISCKECAEHISICGRCGRPVKLRYYTILA